MSTLEANQLKKGASNLRVTLGILGLFTAILGLLILIFPAQSGEAAMLIIAGIVTVYAFIAGIGYIGNSIFSKTLRPWERVGNILLGLLYLLGGVILLINLTAAAAVLAVFISVIIGVLWIIEGIMVFTALGESPSKGWSFFYGIVSIIAGILLILMPLLGLITLWWLVGISMLVLGIVQIVRAFTINPNKFAGV